MSLEEKQAWQELHGFKSFGIVCDEFYNQVSCKCRNRHDKLITIQKINKTELVGLVLRG